MYDLTTARQLDDHEQLLKVVRSVRNRWRLKMALRGTAILLATAAALLFVVGYAIDAARFDPTTVVVARVLAYLTLAVVLWRFLARPLLRRVSDERVALYLEENEPTLKGRVIAAIELGGERPENVSAALVERLVHSAAEECHQVGDGKRIERKGLLRSSGWMAGSTAMSLALFVAGPAFLFHTTPLLLDPWKESAVVNPYSILVEPGDTVLTKGADLEVTAVLQNFDTAEVDLVVEGSEGEWKRWSMLAETDKHSLIVFDVLEPTRYFVEASGVESPVYTVDVRELPYVAEIDLTYHFPPYTGLDPVEQPGSGDVAALVGTEVRLEIGSTLPVTGGALELEDGATIPLTLTDGRRLSGSLTVGEPSSYHVLLDSVEGERVLASPDYLIDPFTDQPPILTVTKPGRDIQVTSLEEVTIELRAQDDYGIQQLDVFYSINGGEEHRASIYRGEPGRKDFAGTHTLYLEEHELEPGDLVSYYARAVDGSTGEESHETVADIYFLEIRPFDRNFRQADAGGGGQGQAPGMSGDELTAQQRLIIAATFKLARARKDKDGPGYAGDVVTVALSQGRLRQEVDAVVAQMLSRGLFSGEDSPVATMIETLPQASAEMTVAEESLGEHKVDEALLPEQRALRFLQRAEAAFRDIRVAQQQGGGGGGGQGISEELSDLFEMERDRLANQYEQVQRGERRSVDDTIDEMLERLRELARRQQQENERMRARAQQQSGQQAGSSGESQRQLAEQAEEMARRLERLAREESLPELAETARRLREAAEEMRRAAASGERTEEALGQTALDQLREARRQLERDKSGRLERDTRQALERTRRLREQQERMVDRVERLDPMESGYDEALRDVHEAKERMGGEVGSLEGDIDQLSRDSKRDQPEASRRLDAAAGEIRDNKIREKILYSRGVVEQRSKDYALNFEEHIEDALGQLEQRLEAAVGAIGETREQRLEQALEKTREVVTALESLEERLRAGGEGQGAAAGDAERENPNAGEQGGAGGRMRPQDFRQFGRELRERRAQLEALRGELRREGVDAAELDRIIGRMEELGSWDALANLEAVNVLEREVVQGLKEFEYSLRRTLGPSGDERLLQVGDEEVPDGYEEMVEAYYKALAGEKGDDG